MRLVFIEIHHRECARRSIYDTFERDEIDSQNSLESIEKNRMQLRIFVLYFNDAHSNFSRKPKKYFSALRSSICFWNQQMTSSSNQLSREKRQSREAQKEV